MDNRTDIRPGAVADPAAPPDPPVRPTAGHAWYAEQARQALGIGRENVLVHVPAPLFHGAVGVAVAAIAVLVRPSSLADRSGIAVDLLLAVVAGASIVYYDRLVCPVDARPGAEAAALPAAALLSLALALAGTEGLRSGAVMALLTALVITGVPHLDALRAAGRDRAVWRLLRDVGGVTVMVPVSLAGASAPLHPATRAAIVLVGAWAVTLDALRVERAGRVRTLAAATVVGLLAAVVAAMAAAGATQTTGAAALLAMWYGLRGIAAGAAAGRLTRGPLVEYGAFVVLAGGVLGLSAASR